MANNKSAKKRIKIAQRNNERNTLFRSRIKTYVKKTADAIESKADTLTEDLQATIKVVDSVASKGIIHKNKAARIKSRLTKKVNSIKA